MMRCALVVLAVAAGAEEVPAPRLAGVVAPDWFVGGSAAVCERDVFRGQTLGRNGAAGDAYLTRRLSPALGVGGQVFTFYDATRGRVAEYRGDLSLTMRYRVPLPVVKTLGLTQAVALGYTNYQRPGALSGPGHTQEAYLLLATDVPWRPRLRLSYDFDHNVGFQARLAFTVSLALEREKRWSLDILPELGFAAAPHQPGWHDMGLRGALVYRNHGLSCGPACDFWFNPRSVDGGRTFKPVASFNVAYDLRF